MSNETFPIQQNHNKNSANNSSKPNWFIHLQCHFIFIWIFLFFQYWQNYIFATLILKKSCQMIFRIISFYYLGFRLFGSQPTQLDTLFTPILKVPMSCETNWPNLLVSKFIDFTCYIFENGSFSTMLYLQNALFLLKYQLFLKTPKSFNEHQNRKKLQSIIDNWKKFLFMKNIRRYLLKNDIILWAIFCKVFENKQTRLTQILIYFEFLIFFILLFFIKILSDLCRV